MVQPKQPIFHSHKHFFLNNQEAGPKRKQGANIQQITKIESLAQVFLRNFAKFLRTPLIIEQLWWLFLKTKQSFTRSFITAFNFHDFISDTQSITLNILQQITQFLQINSMDETQQRNSTNVSIFKICNTSITIKFK